MSKQAARFGLRVVAVTVFIATLSPVNAGVNETSFTLGQIFTAPTPRGYENFGRSVSSAGEDILIAALGRAFLLDGNTGELRHSFKAPDTGDNAAFGYALAGNARHVLIGAPGSVRAPEKAYLFDKVTGALLQTYISPEKFTENPVAGFGSAVAIEGNRVLIGAPNAEPPYQGGAAYVFNASTGDLLYSLTDPEPYALSRFGVSVAFVDGHPVIGGGGAYMFDGSTGQLLHSYTEVPQGGIASVAPIDTNVLVGHVSTQSAYLFDGNTGELLRMYQNPSKEVASNFGIAVASIGSKVLVGADSDRSFVLRDGGVYIFDSKSGALVDEILNPDPDTGDAFGGAIAVVGDDIVIGARGDDTATYEAGAVYLYRSVPDTGDDDSDGCTDDRELGPDARAGGQRNPKYFWDIMDVWHGLPPVKDRAVTVTDIVGVVRRFGTYRDPIPDKQLALAGALTLPTDLVSYHPAFDRSQPGLRSPQLALGPPNGAISVEDILVTVLQFGHSCL